MHLGNGAITPGCAAVTFGAATAGLGVAVATLRRTALDRNQLLTAGALTGAIFAAQMVNVPVLPFSSAHLVGGVLAAWVLGPSLGALSMAVVLTGQALLLGDGGLMALGANIINMGLVPAGMVYLVRGRATRTAAGTTAALAVVAAALLIIGEVVLFRGQFHGILAFALRMIGIHLWIAVPEGLLTVAILQMLGGVTSAGKLRLDEVRLAGCWGVAAMLVMCCLPFASPMPDGYEAAAELSGMHLLLADNANGFVAAWQREIVSRIQAVLATEQLLGLVATAFAGSAAFLLAKLVARRSPPVRQFR